MLNDNFLSCQELAEKMRFVVSNPYDLTIGIGVSFKETTMKLLQIFNT